VPFVFGDSDLERYIELTGEGQFQEEAVSYVAEITFEVRAAKDETAFREISELFEAGVSTLRSNGINDDEMTDGGTDVKQPWYSRKKVGQNVSRKLILKVEDVNRLTLALEKLEPLQSENRERKTISVDMRQPVFEASAETRGAALAAAYDDARKKGLMLCESMNATLGNPVFVEEGGSTKRNSGFSGDEDWNGDSARFGYGGVYMAAPGGASADLDSHSLANPTRTIFVRCRARFAITPP
jgi:uncharacterized protein YggE